MAQAFDKNKTQDELTRIAILNKDRCKPKKCNQECKRGCPVNRIGKFCIQVESDSVIAYFSEHLCIGLYFGRSVSTHEKQMIKIYLHCLRLWNLRSSKKNKKNIFWSIQHLH